MSLGWKYRARRGVAIAAGAIGLFVTFPLAVAAGTLVHLDLAPTRRVVANATTRILAGVLRGEVTVDRLGKLGIGGIEGLDVHVRDPDGEQVLVARGVKVHLRTLDLLQSLLLEKGDIRIRSPEVSIDHAEVALDVDPMGALRIARAFLPRPSDTEPEPSEGPGRGVYVDAPQVRLVHAWAHGNLVVGAPAIDAEALDLAGSARIDRDGIHAALDEVTIVARGLPRGADPRGKVSGRFRRAPDGPAPDAPAPPIFVTASFDGRVAGAATVAYGTLDDRRVDAALDMRDADGERVAASVSELAIVDALVLHAEAHGDLSNIQAVLAARLGKTTADVGATISLGDATKIDGRVSARHVDLARIAAGAPRSELGLDGHALVVLEGGVLRGAATVDSLPGSIEGDAVPRVSARATMEGDRVDATARIHEPTMPTEVRVTMIGQGEGRFADAHAHARIPDLAKLPKVGHILAGSAEVAVDARVGLAAKSVEGRAVVTGHGLRQGDVSVAGLVVDARASGTLDAPVIETDVHAEDLRAGDFTAGRVRVDARVRPGKETFVDRVAVEVTRGPTHLRASAGPIRVAGSDVEVHSGMVVGLGAPIRADFARSRLTTALHVDAPRIDMMRVQEALGRDLGIKNGTVRVAGTVNLGRHDASGELHLGLEHFCYQKLDEAALDLDAVLDGRSLALDVDGRLAEAGTFKLHTDRIKLDGPAMDAPSWTGASGRVHLDAGIDLAKILSIVPREQRPVADLAGRLVVVGTIGRDSARVPPELRMHAHSVGLVATGGVSPEKPLADGTHVDGVAAWRTSGVDFAFEVLNDATSGQTGIAVRATDARGILGALDAKAIVPYDAIFADPTSATVHLLRAPMRAKFVVPERSLSTVPEVVGVSDMVGNVAAVLDLEGTALDPRAHLVAAGRGVRRKYAGRGQEADLDLDMTYDGQAANVGAVLRSDKRAILEVQSRVDVRTSELLERRADGRVPWGASGRAKFDRFPLATVAPLAERRIRGQVSGEVSLDGLHDDAKATAHLVFDRLTVGGAKYEGAKFDMEAGAGKAKVTARFDQTDGFAELEASTGIAWGKALAPTLSGDQSIDARLVAKAFRAAAIQPFLAGSVDTLDGRIDADARARIDPTRKGAELSGAITLREGSVQIPAMGEPMNDVRANVTLSPDGTIRLDDLVARGVTGELTGSAVAKLDGMRLERAEANIHVPKKRALDLVTSSQPLRDVWGDVKVGVTQSADARTTKIAVDVPTFSIDIPQTTKTGVQGLGPRDDVRVGVYRPGGTFARLPLDKQDFSGVDDAPAPSASTLDVDVRLGRIEVQRGNSARVVVAGNPKVRIEGGQTKVTGEVHVVEGWADVQGKKFEVERATATFNGETPPNPVIVATAGWSPPDGSRIYADFVGPVKTGKVTLRAEPARPQNEILAMVLFGTADGANPGPAPSGKQPDGTQKAAMGIGGGYAAQGLTEAIDDLSGIEATARIDSSSARNPRPEIEFQVSQRVSVAFSHIIGQPPVTEPPDKNLATIDWRFRNNWSFETTVGDRGRALFDLLWQRRY